MLNYRHMVHTDTGTQTVNQITESIFLQMIANLEEANFITQVIIRFCTRSFPLSPFHWQNGTTWNIAFLPLSTGHYHRRLKVPVSFVLLLCFFPTILFFFFSFFHKTAINWEGRGFDIFDETAMNQAFDVRPPTPTPDTDRGVHRSNLSQAE